MTAQAPFKLECTSLRFRYTDRRSWVSCGEPNVRGFKAQPVQRQYQAPLPHHQ